MANVGQPMTGQWKNGLCGCCEVCGDLWFAGCCGSCYNYTVGKAAGDENLGIIACLGSMFTGFPAIGLCCIRRKIREQRGIEGSEFEDLVCTTCCSCCTAIQMKREVEDR